MLPVRTASVALLLLSLSVCAFSVETSLNAFIYSDATSLPCVRLLNQEGTLGCQAQATGGILYSVNTSSQLDTFLSDPSLNGRFMVLMPYTLFTQCVQICCRVGRCSLFAFV